MLHDITHACELKNNGILEYDLSAKDFDLPPYDLKELQIENAQESTQACLDILENKGKDSAYNGGCGECGEFVVFKP